MELNFLTKQDQNSKTITGMTVFNTESVDTKKQPMFFGKPLEFRDMIHTSIQFLIS